MLTPKPLTAELFRPFGEVIQIDPAKSIEINQGTTLNFSNLAEVEVQDSNSVKIHIFSTCLQARPIKIDRLERHPLGSQAFLPSHGVPFLSVVAESPTADLQVFITNGRQGVHYRTGVWHSPLIGLQKDQKFWIIDRGADGENLELVDLPKPVFVHLADDDE